MYVKQPQRSSLVIFWQQIYRFFFVFQVCDFHNLVKIMVSVMLIYLLTPTVVSRYVNRVIHSFRDFFKVEFNQG